MENGGCWIFLCHSSKDIEKVRIIRNAFERQGHNPLAFHLRCLVSDTEEGKKELDSLIKREIDCREWFIFCESEEAQKSPYVKMEKEYINSKKKYIWKIDMNLPEEQLIEKVDHICRSVRVFMSYDRIDLPFAKVITDDLICGDYDVRLCKCEQNNENKDSLNTFYDKNLGECFIALITDSYKNSTNSMNELEYAVSKNIHVIKIEFSGINPAEMVEYGKSFVLPLKSLTDCPHLVSTLIKGAIAYHNFRLTGEYDIYNSISRINEEINPEHRYHPSEPIYISNTGALHDYCDVYQFPCCGKYVLEGKSRFRADGCCRQEKK